MEVTLSSDTLRQRPLGTWISGAVSVPESMFFTSTDDADREMGRVTVDDPSADPTEKSEAVDGEDNNVPIRDQSCLCSCSLIDSRVPKPESGDERYCSNSSDLTNSPTTAPTDAPTAQWFEGDCATDCWCSVSEPKTLPDITLTAWITNVGNFNVGTGWNDLQDKLCMETMDTSGLDWSDTAIHWPQWISRC